MTASDVLDIVMGRTDPPVLTQQEDIELAIMAWCALVERMKPGQAYMPLAPHEIDRARRVLRALLDAVDVAKARKPGPFRPVEPGGR